MHRTALDMALYLKSLPYLERRIVLRSPPNSFPRFIYKYLNPDIKGEWLRNYLIDSKIYLSSPADFNDPFDMKMDVIDEPDVGKKRYYFEKLLKKNARHLTWREQASKVNSAMTDSSATFKKLKDKSCGVSRYFLPQY